MRTTVLCVSTRDREKRDGGETPSPDFAAKIHLVGRLCFDGKPQSWCSSNGNTRRTEAETKECGYCCTFKKKKEGENHTTYQGTNNKTKETRNKKQY